MWFDLCEAGLGLGWVLRWDPAHLGAAEIHTDHADRSEDKVVVGLEAAKAVRTEDMVEH